MRAALTAGFIVLLAMPLLAEAEETSRPVVRLTIAPAPPARTWWQQLARLLGARRLPPGTTLAVTSTAYAPSPFQTDNTPCITAAGTRVRPGTVAANWLPLGTLLNINGEVYIVEDRMHPRFQRSIDIFFPSTSEALAFGRRLLTVSIIGYGTPGQPIRETAPEKPPPKPSPAKKTPAKKAPPQPAPVPSEPDTQREGESVSGLVPEVQIVRPTLRTRARLAWYSLHFYLQSVAARRRGNVNRFDVDCFADQSAWAL